MDTSKPQATSIIRGGAVALTVAAVLAGTAACGGGENSPSASKSAGSAAAPSAGASSEGSGGAQASSGTQQAGVKRGKATGDPKVDVLVTVHYAKGKVTPAVGAVKVKAGQHVKVLVSSDSDQDITVGDDPDKTADVAPGDPEDVSFSVKSGSTVVALKQAGKKLVTFQA